MLALVLAAALAQTSPVLSYDAALAQAKERNLDLKAMQARLDQSRLLSRKAWAGYLPTLTVGGSYQHNNVEAKISLPTGYYVRDVAAPQGPVFDPSRDPGLDNPPGKQTSFLLVPSGLATAT